MQLPLPPPAVEFTLGIHVHAIDAPFLPWNLLWEFMLMQLPPLPAVESTLGIHVHAIADCGAFQLKLRHKFVICVIFL